MFIWLQPDVKNYTFLIVSRNDWVNSHVKCANPAYASGDDRNQDQ